MNAVRRRFLKVLAGTGVGTVTLHRAVVALAQEQSGSTPDLKIDKDLLKQAEWISGNELTDEQREEIIREVDQTNGSLNVLREQILTPNDMPAVYFNSLVSQSDPDVQIQRSVDVIRSVAAKRPASETDLAFMPVTELSKLVRSGQVTSIELTKLYLARLKKYAPMLNCVVNYTEELAMDAATRADKEIAAGRYRGPLHGIPWGAKDLISVPGYPTTYGIPQKREQFLKERATVFHRLEQAGAVLIAKLSLGAIAMGDRWFEGMTRSPWNYKIGSSGSSAGSASATVAGCVGFSLGSETLGSIISPSRRCGANGLRPTFGRVSRHGCMPLSWTMDKIGPITRCVEDTALVLAAIHGADGLDPTAIDQDFHWPPRIDVRNMTVGFTKSRRETEDRDDLKILKDLGIKMVEVELPSKIPLRGLTSVIGVEGAAVFEELLNSDQTEGWNAWPRIFRGAQFMSAVDYLRIMRLRRKLMHDFEEMMQGVDVLINANDLLHTNLTGHPSIVFPVGFRDRNGVKTPRSTILTGHLFGETKLLALAHAYQSQLTAHLEQPPLDENLTAFEKALAEGAEDAEAEEDKAKGDKAKDDKSKKDKTDKDK